ncbi:MAG: hypothetical protein Fur0025_18910 [Oscillatoriaceae cyanobacterium]
MKMAAGVLAGALIALGTAYPSVAEPAATPGEQLVAQATMREAYRGKVSSVNNQIVSLTTPNGDTRRLDIPRTTQTRLGIVPGTEIIVFDDDSYAVLQNDGTYAIVDKNGGVRMVETLPTQPTTTTTERRTVSQPATSRPVRALW